VDTFGDGKSLRQRQINDRQPWSDERVSALIPKSELSTRRCRDKGRSVEPLAGAWIAHSRVAHHVGIPTAAVAASSEGSVKVIVCGNGERIAALGDKSSRQAPSTCDFAYEVTTVQIGLSFTERQLVRGISLEGIADVKVGATVIGARVVSDLPNLCSATVAPSRRILLVLHVRPNVVDIEG